MFRQRDRKGNKLPNPKGAECYLLMTYDGKKLHYASDEKDIGMIETMLVLAMTDDQYIFDVFGRAMLFMMERDERKKAATKKKAPAKKPVAKKGKK